MDGHKITVTGGAGYLGSMLVPELLKLGHSVTVLDNFMYRQSPLLDCCASSRFEVIRGDARDERTLKAAIAGAGYILPLAALVGAPLCGRDELGTVSTNRDAVALLARIASKEQRIIMPTTNSGYGTGHRGEFCTEETPLNPVSTYGRTKMEAERIILGRGNAISLRLATVFGASPRMRLDLLVNDFTYRAVKDRFVVVFEGHFKRNYIHVRDVARAFVHAMDNFEAMRDNAYNVGLSDANLSKLELCAAIKEEVPSFVYVEAPVGEDPDKRDYIVSNEKIERAGFRPMHTLRHGIRELVKGYRMITNSRFGNV
ncbi:MAG TPA: NAD(P)-dependent oxidoreductase [Thermodesulfobacteriota bacterium]